MALIKHKKEKKKKKKIKGFTTFKCYALISIFFGVCFELFFWKSASHDRCDLMDNILVKSVFFFLKQFKKHFLVTNINFVGENWLLICIFEYIDITLFFPPYIFTYLFIFYQVSQLRNNSNLKKVPSVLIYIL